MPWKKIKQIKKENLSIEREICIILNRQYFQKICCVNHKLELWANIQMSVSEYLDIHGSLFLKEQIKIDEEKANNYQFRYQKFQRTISGMKAHKSESISIVGDIFTRIHERSQSNTSL